MAKESGNQPRESITLPPRIHFNEFTALNVNMSNIEKAGFQVYCKGKTWMRTSEWQALYDAYIKPE